MAVSRVYLDTSVYVRPFDDQSQSRIWLETQAITVIMQMIESRSVLLVASSIVQYEVGRHPEAEHRSMVAQLIELAQEVHNVGTSLLPRAQVLSEQGIKAIDALHIACAELSNCNFFVTCDDRLIRRYRSLADGSLRVVEPTEFVRILSEGESQGLP